MYRLHSLFDFINIKEQVHNEYDSSLELIAEGGAFGHMSHPFDDLTLTFNQIHDITKISLSGELHKEETATEKLDGQALAISWKNGKLIAARNKGDRKNFGENAPDVTGVINKFAGRGGLSDAFSFAASDLESAISSLKNKDLDEIFSQGKKFMHLEIIYPASSNVINYDAARIIFHSVTEYDKDGEAIAEDKSAAKKLQQLIKSVNSDIQKHYKIVPPVAVNLPKHLEFDDKLKYFVNKLNKIQNEFGLRGDSNIEDYLRHQFMEDIDREDNEQELTSLEIDGLLRRWVNNDKTFTIRGLSSNVRNSNLGKWIDNYDKKEVEKNYKKYIYNIEIYFLELGATILKNMSGFLAVNPDKVVQNIRDEVNRTIKELESSGDINKLNKINDYVNKLNAIGGLNSIVPSEGIVFTYNGKTYKFTGAFAPLNQITGLLKF